MLGGAVVLLSVAALVYYLFKKRRDAKLELEREITAKAQLINTVVDTLNASENDQKLRTPRKRSSRAKTPQP
jgi:CHASE1-domain containing sensor protein